MSIKKHYKLYKAGKQWCTAAIATMAVFSGTLFFTHTAFAESVNKTSDLTSAVSNTANEADSNSAQYVNKENDQVSATTNTISANETTSSISNIPSVQTILPSGRPGWQLQDNNWYYFNQNGLAVTGWQQINSNWYYFDTDNGQMWSGLRQVNNGPYYYFNPYHNGFFGAMQTGWQKINNQWYGFGGQNDGAAYTGWRDINGNWYYFLKNGQAQTGWQKINNNWYYFDPVNAWALRGWQSINNRWYYFDPTNVWAQKGWMQTRAGNWYYFDPINAWAETGWQKINGSWYYFDNHNAWAETDWQLINDHWYYFDPINAWALTNWHKLDGTWYYFDPTNAWALTGHQNINGHKYYFNDRGRMTNQYGKIENGKLVIYDAATDQKVKIVEPGPWENVAYSQDSNSINNIDGYLSYSGWYRPYGTSQDGKTWYKTSASDWRPILMYVWPNKDVEAQFIKYFVNHGYENADYNLTKTSVNGLSANTDSQTLDDVAQNLRYVIEQHIAENKSTSQLANDINGFMATIPSLSAASELSVVNSIGYIPDHSGTVDKDQVIFVNNNSRNQRNGDTSYADSNYRLMNRTINNQTNSDQSDNSPELLVGNDIDNSNPIVQAENLNWEYFLLNYGKLKGYNSNGNFDGFRIDAADNIDADVLDQVAQLVNDLYHTKGNAVNANNHLIYNEGYHSGAAQMLNQKNNPELYMDSGYFYTLENVLGRAHGRDSINNLITNSIVNRANDVSDNQATPNWSFVTNHDQRKNVINQIIIDNHPGVADIMANGYKASYATEAWKQFYADQSMTNKHYAQYNLPAQYALLLSNKDTVPQVYYGDLYNETDQYMQTKSMYYDAITALMKARAEFVSGGQAMNKINDHLLTSVRYGKGVMNALSMGTDPLSRTTGMAVVVGNDPSMKEQVVEINMGAAHANEKYRNLIDSTDDGLTYDDSGAINPEVLSTDSKGILRVVVKGYSNPYVSGYLSVWVPLINGDQDARTSSQEVENAANKTYVSNAALDSHMIWEDFSLFEPEPTSTTEHAYNVIKNNANLFSNLGITDFWMAPSYMPFNMSRYNEGYSMTDRYDLGTAKNPTKYGSGEELADAIAALHEAGLRVQEDLVMNQMIGFSGQEAVTVTRTDEHAKQLTVDGHTFANEVYFAYTRGGGEGQKEYGGKYLAELKAKYPDLFTTKAASTGVAPDPNTRIQEWSAKYQNGTSLQNIGIGLAVKIDGGNYAYLNSANNHMYGTLLPDAMSSLDYYINRLNQHVFN